MKLTKSFSKFLKISTSTITSKFPMFLLASNKSNDSSYALRATFIDLQEPVIVVNVGHAWREWIITVLG